METGRKVMDFARLFDQFESEMEDFWHRRETVPEHSCHFQILGRAVRLSSNEAGVLHAVDHVLPLYSRLPAVDQQPFEVQITVQPARVPPRTAPEDLMDSIWYSGHGSWLMIQLGGWGACFVDLGAGRAAAVLVPELAQRPKLVSRCLLNTILLNFCLASGYGMMHASCLYKEGRVLLLLAPHNSGKSTTALRLALAGYELVTDSMILIPPFSQKLTLAGFPVGIIKLRQDVLAQFPGLRRFLEVEQVRDETKYRVDLRRLDSSAVRQDAVVPEQVELCFLSRSAETTTRLKPAATEDVWQAIMKNSLYFDAAETWQRNLEQLQRCVNVARWHHLSVGSDPQQMVAAVSQLWEV